MLLRTEAKPYNKKVDIDAEGNAKGAADGDAEGPADIHKFNKFWSTVS